MRKYILFFVIISILISIQIVSKTKNQSNWSQWRGPSNNGIVPFGDPPIEWSEKKNIKWKISIPGKGLATPIVWGNQLFIQTAVVSKDQSKAKNRKDTRKGKNSNRRWMRGIDADKVLDFKMISINRKNGKILWEKTLNTELPHEGTHGDATWASGSPVTDGKHLYAYFGSWGLYCLDMKGNLKWKKKLGKMRTRNAFGEGSSPFLFGDKIIILWDHEGDSFIFALDKKNGKEIWKKPRLEATSWSTPYVYKHKDKVQVIVNGHIKIISYDFETGEEIWTAKGMTKNVIPTPVHNGKGIFYFASGFRGTALLAIDINNAKGDLTGTKNIVWSYDKNTPYTPSTLYYKGILYFLKVNRGNITALNGETGVAYYSSKRLEETRGVYASPIGVKDRIYIIGRNGVTYVLKAGKEFKVLSINKLDDGVDASPVVIGKNLYIRGLKTLYCISTQ